MRVDMVRDDTSGITDKRICQSFVGTYIELTCREAQPMQEIGERPGIRIVECIVACC